jgi:hypothetical protein
MEQPEYMKMPRGLARQSETPEARAEEALSASPTESDVYSGCGLSQQTLRKQPFSKTANRLFTHFYIGIRLFLHFFKIDQFTRMNNNAKQI